MEGYPVTTRIEVRWRDIDALGHVNNAVFFTYLEIARTRYHETVFGARSLADVDFLLASVRCDFVSPVVYGEGIEAGIRVASVGRTSWTFEYELRSARDGRVVARARSTQVRFDHARGRKQPIGPDWIERVTRAQGAPPDRLPPANGSAAP